MSGSSKQYRAGTLTYTSGGILVLFFWLLGGDFVWSMKERAVGSIATLIVKSFGISDFLYGILIVSFPNFTNIILGPIISYKSDRYRSRLGRRIPFLLFTTPFVVVGICGIGFSPQLGRQLQAVIGSAELSLETASLIIFCIFWVILDFGTTLTNSIFTALMNDVVPGCFLGRFFSLFRAVSLGAGVLFNSCFLEKVEQYAPVMCAGLGALYAVGLLSLCIHVKEGQYPPVSGTPEEQRGKFGNPLPAVKTYFRESFSHPYYRWIFLSYTLCTLTNMPVNIFTIFYAQSVNMSMAELADVWRLPISSVFRFVIRSVCWRIGFTHLG